MHRQDRRFIIQTTALFLLVLGIVLQAGHLLVDTRWASLDLTGADTATLSAPLEAFLDRQTSPLSITYFVTSASQMPAHMREVEPAVRALLDAMRAHAPDRVDVRVMDPALGGDAGAAFAARKKVSPFHVRRIETDEFRDAPIWSSLVLGRQDLPEALIQKILPSDLPLLQDLMLKTLAAQVSPPKPAIALSAPPHFRLFQEHLRTFGQVRLLNLERGAHIPDDTDVLFWFEPQRVTQAHVDALKNFIAKGHTAVLAGSPYAIDYSITEARQQIFKPHPLGTGWQTLLSPFGIRPMPDLLMDESHGPIFFQDASGQAVAIEAPFHLRVMPGYYHLDGFLGPARGALNFVASGALAVDARANAQRDVTIRSLATTTEDARVQPLPQVTFTREDLSGGLKVDKQNLMLRVQSNDPWAGEMLVLASASPFRDGIFNQPNYAHRVFTQTLMRTFTAPSRIVRGRLARPSPPPLPKLSSASRIFWRVFGTYLVPVVLIACAIRRLGPFSRLRPSGLRVSALRLSGALFGLCAAALLGRMLPAWSIDLTAEKRNTIHPFAYGKLADQGFKADLIIPSRANLPTSLKDVEITVTELLKGVDIPCTVRRPAELTQRDRARLADLGIRPFTVETVRHDAEISEEVWSGMVLHRPGAATAIARLDDRTASHTEFLLAAAAERLNRGDAPHIAVLAEPPRLSPAEAFEYQQKGLSPPKGADVFSELKSLLRDSGYRVTYVDPRTPELPPETDLVCWLQPRRDARRAIRAVSRFLADGGSAIVALQHYNIQQRQYRGSGFETVYWPQPQYQDLNPYLEPLGVIQIREILMDRTRGHLGLPTQIHRRAVRETETQEVALPFLIRAVAETFDPRSPITRALGDQLFIWGNRFAADPGRLSAHGLRAQTLISTSNQAWSYRWEGGWLAPEMFAPDSLLLGEQPLALLVGGSFPVAEWIDDSDGTSAIALKHPAQNPPGQLLLIGSSEMFKNQHLYARGYQHDQFLLNAVAQLALGPKFAELQAKHGKPRGFSYVSAQRKLTWRIIVLTTGPGLLIAFGLFRVWQNRAGAPLRRPS